MDALRKIPFFIALALLAAAVLIEIVSLGLLDFSVPGGPHTSANGVVLQALIDGIMFYLIAWMGISLLPGRYISARVQSVMTVVLCVCGIIGAVVLAMAMVGLIVLMIGLLLAIPFGTLIYLAKFGSFNVDAALAALGIVMLLKLYFVGALGLAHQGFLKNPAMLALIICSLALTWLSTLLISFPPGFLASITDAVAGLVIAIVAVIWFVFLGVSSFIGVVRGLKIKTQANQR